MVSKIALFVACLVLLLAGGEAALLKKLLLKKALLFKKKMAMAKLHHADRVPTPVPATPVEPRVSGENMIAPRVTGESMIAPRVTGESMLAPQVIGEMEMEVPPPMVSADTGNFIVMEKSMTTPHANLGYRITKLRQWLN